MSSSIDTVPVPELEYNTAIPQDAIVPDTLPPATVNVLPETKS